MAGSSAERVVRPDNGQHSELANDLRALAMDAVQQANSGSGSLTQQPRRNL